MRNDKITKDCNLKINNAQNGKKLGISIQNLIRFSTTKAMTKQEGTNVCCDTDQMAVLS